jgi:hypothetical protein
MGVIPLSLAYGLYTCQNVEPPLTEFGFPHVHDCNKILMYLVLL